VFLENVLRLVRKLVAHKDGDLAWTAAG
jgi:hypothetical protein